MHTRKSKTIFFVFEGLNALATSYFGSYVFFLLRDRFGFGNLGNLSVSALGGFVYIFAAWLGGRFAQRFGYFTSLKTGFGGLAVCLGLGALLPWLPAVILVYLGYATTVCFTWPTLEALVSDGVGDDILPKNIGIYNVVWSAGAASMYFVGGTLYETLGHDSVFWLPALIHGGLCLAIFRLGKNPIPTKPLPPQAVAPHPLEAAAFSPTRQPADISARGVARDSFFVHRDHHGHCHHPSPGEIAGAVHVAGRLVLLDLAVRPPGNLRRPLAMDRVALPLPLAGGRLCWADGRLRRLASFHELRNTRRRPR